MQRRLSALGRWSRSSWRLPGVSLAIAGIVFTLGPHAMTQPAPATSDATIVLTQEPITPIPAPPPADPLKIALGEELFQSQLLSHNQTMSCATCHDIHSNGADNRQHDIGSNGKALAFNTPTVFNAALSFRLHWEGDEFSLESQARLALSGSQGLGSTMPEILARLRGTPDIAQQFRAAYGHDADEASVLNALSTYERSLLTPDSRFDRWLTGDKDALSPAEKDGYALFKSLGCISCHQGVNVGGNMFQRQGIFHRLVAADPKVVRVPSLRNVATTAPYFHDGSAPTLPEAVRRMAAAQLDQTLSKQEIDTLVAFLDSLTGNYRGVSVKAAAR